MAEKMTKRKEQALRTRQRILDSALALFRKQDFEKTTISQICRQAGVSTGNFYHYFKDKEDILFLDYYTFDEYIEQEFVHREFHSAIEAIRELIRCEVTRANRYGVNILAQLLRIQLRRDGRFTFNEDPTRPLHIRLRELVVKAQNEGSLHPSHDPDDITQAILRMSRGIGYDWSVRSGPYSIEVQVLSDLDVLLCGFAQKKVPFKE